MTKSKKLLVSTLTTGGVLGLIVLSQGDSLPEHAEASLNLAPGFVDVHSTDESDKQKEVGSIELNPGMYIPEESLLVNQKVDKSDVIKTLNLQEISLSRSSGLAEISAGLEIHLGIEENALSSNQVNTYNQQVISYAKKIQETAELANEAVEVDVVVQEFRTWAASYRNEINESIKEELARAVEEAEAKKVKEVVSETLTADVPNPELIEYALPNLGDEYLTYMDYKAITAKTTPHYKLQQISKTDDEGYRVFNGYRAVALASSYGTKIGTLYEITFEDGKVLKAILADNKSDKHTDNKKQYRDASERYDGSSGNIVEIVFDSSGHDSINSVNRKINGDYPAHVKSIKKIGLAEEFAE